MARIERLTAEQVEKRLDQFVEFVQDTTESGASTGFLPPVSNACAPEGWARFTKLFSSTRRFPFENATIR